MAHQHHNPQFGHNMIPMGNAAIAGPAILTGTGCMLAIPLITYLSHIISPSTRSTPVTDGGFVEFPKPINATPDKGFVSVPLHGVETSADTTATIAFIDILEAYEKEQEEMKLAAEAKERALAEKAAREAEETRVAEAEKAEAASKKWDSDISGAEKSIALAMIIAFFFSMVWLGLKLAGPSWDISSLPTTIGYCVGGWIKDRLSAISVFLKYLCLAILTRREPDMENLAITVRKGMLTDRDFLKQVASSPEFLAMIVQQPVFAMFVDEKVKHCHEREFAQFKAKVIDPLLSRVATMGVTVDDMGKSIRDMKVDFEVALALQSTGSEKKQGLLVESAIASFKKDHFDGLETELNSFMARSDADKNLVTEEATRVVDLAVAKFKHDHFDDLSEECNILKKLVDGKKVEDMGSIIAGFRKEVNDLEANFNGFVEQTAVDKESRGVEIVDIMKAANNLEAQFNSFRKLVFDNKVEDSNLVKRLFMITYRDHATATRFSKATDGKRDTDEVHAVITAHIETLAILIHELKRKFDPPAPMHGQPSPRANWGPPQPSFTPTAGGNPNGMWPTPFFPPANPNSFAPTHSPRAYPPAHNGSPYFDHRQNSPS